MEHPPNISVEVIDSEHFRVKYKGWNVRFSREGGLHVEEDHTNIPDVDWEIIWNAAKEADWEMS